MLKHPGVEIGKKHSLWYLGLKDTRKNGPVRAGTLDEGPWDRRRRVRSIAIICQNQDTSAERKQRRKTNCFSFSPVSFQRVALTRSNQKLASQGVWVMQCVRISLRAQKRVEKDREWVSQSKEGRQKMESSQHKCVIRIILIFKTILWDKYSYSHCKR